MFMNKDREEGGCKSVKRSYAVRLRYRSEGNSIKTLFDHIIKSTWKVKNSIDKIEVKKTQDLRRAKRIM